MGCAIKWSCPFLICLHYLTVGIDVEGHWWRKWWLLENNLCFYWFLLWLYCLSWFFNLFLRYILRVRYDVRLMSLLLLWLLHLKTRLSINPQYFHLQWHIDAVVLPSFQTVPLPTHLLILIILLSSDHAD